MSRMRVLVVDGYEASRLETARELELAGFEVVAVEEEEEAIDAFAGAAFDVVLLDLPLSEAEEAARALQSRDLLVPRPPSARPVTVIAIVPPSSPRRLREQAHASGIDYLLLRPCPPKEIVKHLRRSRR